MKDYIISLLLVFLIILPMSYNSYITHTKLIHCRYRNFALFQHISNIYYGRNSWNINDKDHKDEIRFNEFIKAQIQRELEM